MDDPRSCRADPFRIFISYRRNDTAPYAGRLYDALIARYGPDVAFLDTESIPPGSNFFDVINDQLERCSVVVLLISPNWLTLGRLDDPDDIVRLEVSIALRRGVALPVLVGGATMPTPAELPEALAPVASRQAVALPSGPWHLNRNPLIDALDRQRDEINASGRRSHSPNRSRPILWVPVVVALIAAVAILIVTLINRPSPTPSPEQTHTPTTTAPERGSPATPSAPMSAVASAACFSYSNAGGSNAQVIPNSEASTHDVTLLSASYVLDSRVDPPTIPTAGQVSGHVPNGSHLWIAGNPNPQTRDRLGDPGNGHYYPSIELKPDGNGCWRDTVESIGYSDAVGITVKQLLLQVDDRASAEFSNRSAHPDGFTSSDLGRLGADTIAFFDVPTG